MMIALPSHASRIHVPRPLYIHFRLLNQNHIAMGTTISEASNPPKASRLSNGMCTKFTPPNPVSTESGMKIRSR